jgi:hypothetical protein
MFRSKEGAFLVDCWGEEEGNSSLYVPEYSFMYVIVSFSVADPDPPDPRVSASWIRIHYLEVWIRILLSLSKNSKKNLEFYCFVTSF